MIRNFLFHRVSPERDQLWDPMDVAFFDKCISYITGHYQVMLLEDMVSMPNLKNLDNIATILFDDGYKDNIQFAAPILAKYNCKASFYVVTDCIENNIPTWTHILEYRFQYTNKSDINLNFDFFPPDLRVTNLPTKEKRLEYVKKLKPFLKKIPHLERKQALEIIDLSFDDVNLPRIMMDWQDLLQLKIQGHYIGSHSISHCLFGSMTDDSEVLNELLVSGQTIERHLGHFPKTISYPVGSYNKKTIELSKKAGYTIGLAVDQRTYDPSTDSIFEIPRIELYNENWLKTRLRITTHLEKFKTFIGYNK